MQKHFTLVTEKNKRKFKIESFFVENEYFPKIRSCDQLYITTENPVFIDQTDQTDFILSNRFEKIVETYPIFLTAARLAPLYNVYNFDGQLSLRPIEEQSVGTISEKSQMIYFGDFESDMSGLHTELRFDRFVKVERGTRYQTVVELKPNENGEEVLYDYILDTNEHNRQSITPLTDITFENYRFSADEKPSSPIHSFIFHEMICREGRILRKIC